MNKRMGIALVMLAIVLAVVLIEKNKGGITSSTLPPAPDQDRLPSAFVPNPAKEGKFLRAPELEGIAGYINANA